MKDARFKPCARCGLTDVEWDTRDCGTELGVGCMFCGWYFRVRTSKGRYDIDGRAGIVNPGDIAVSVWNAVEVAK